MRTRSIVSLAMALLMALMAVVPAAAEIDAAPATKSGSFTLRLSDPKFTVVQGGEPVERDLLGLSVQLGGVRDASDPNLDNLLLSLMVLANDDPALSAMLGLKGEQLYALVNGISGVLVMPVEQLAGASDSGGISLFGLPLTDMARLRQQIEEIRFVESAPEPVQFIESNGEYPRHSASLNNEQLRALLGGVDLPKDVSCDLSYFTDGADNLRVEGTLFNLYEAGDADGGAQSNMNFELTTQATPEGALSAKGSASGGTAKLTLTLSGAPDADYPDHYALDGQLDFTDENSSGSNGQISFSLFPTEAQDGVPSKLLSAQLTQDGQPLFQLNAVSRVTTQEESYSLVLSDAQSDAQYELSYDGTILRDASETHAGTLRLETSGAEPAISGELQLRLVLSGSAEGKLPDISALEPIDVTNLSEADQQRLASEVQQLQLSMLGKLMTLPSLARIIAQAISGGGFQLGSDPFGP